MPAFTFHIDRIRKKAHVNCEQEKPDMKNSDLKHIAELFNIEGSALSVTPLGKGHLNDTYLVVTDSGR